MGRNHKILTVFLLSRMKDCSRALQRIVPKIDIGRIGSMVEETPFISDLQKQFFLTMLVGRKNVF